MSDGELMWQTLAQGVRCLTCRRYQLTGDGDWLVIMSDESDESDETVIRAMSLRFRLTAREAEVLSWVVKGKINRDIGAVLGTSPMPVKKHLERVFCQDWRADVHRRHGHEPHPAGASAV